MALVIEGILMSKTVVSIQVKVHECQVKKLKPRESLLTIDEESDSSDEMGDCIPPIDLEEVVNEKKE